MTWRFRMPAPPSLNNLFITITGPNGKPMRVKGKKYVAWINAALSHLSQQKKPQEPITYRVNVELEIPRGMQRSDLDNRIKPVFDVLKRGNVWTDDSLVESINARWTDRRDCVVTVEQAAREGGV